MKTTINEIYPCGAVETSKGHMFLGFGFHRQDKMKWGLGCPTHGLRCKPTDVAVGKQEKPQ